MFFKFLFWGGVAFGDTCSFRSNPDLLAGRKEFFYFDIFIKKIKGQQNFFFFLKYQNHLRLFSY